jgi:hypothetical protein
VAEREYCLLFNGIRTGNSVLHGDDVVDNNQEGHHNEAIEVDVQPVHQV